MAKDEDYKRLIHAKRWLLLRRDKLTRCPLCERCQEEGRVTPAVEVHHIIPVEDGISYADKYRLIYNYNNLQALCHRCHTEVHVEMGRTSKVGNARRTRQQLETFKSRFL